VGLGGRAEGRHQAAAVAGAGRQHDVARLDVLERLDLAAATSGPEFIALVP
jgi:hypothetical protein